MRSDPRSLAIGALLTALVALGQISTSIYIPSMPSIVRDLATSGGLVNLTLTGFLAGFAFCQLVFGPLSDRWGRRPTLLVGLALYLGASALCAAATDIRMLIAARVLQGMAACVGPVLGRAIVRDVYGAEDTARAMSYIGAALAVSPAVAPIIGGYLEIWFGWRSAFVFLAGVGLTLLLATLRMLSETSPGCIDGAEDIPGPQAAARLLIADRRYLGYTLAVAFTFAGLMAFAAGGPFVFIGLLGLSPERYGMLAIFSVAGYLAGSLLAGRLVDSMDVRHLVMLGTTISVAGGMAMTGMALSTPLSITAVVAPAAVFTAGLGLVLPPGIAGAMAAFPRIAGTASALLGFLQMLIAAGASFAVGLLPHESALPMASVISASAVLALLTFTILVPWRRSPDR